MWHCLWSSDKGRNDYSCMCDQISSQVTAVLLQRNPLAHFITSTLGLEISHMVILVQIHLNPIRCPIQGYN